MIPRIRECESSCHQTVVEPATLSYKITQYSLQHDGTLCYPAINQVLIAVTTQAVVFWDITSLRKTQKVHYTKRHHSPQDSHSGILGEDYTKVSQFLSELRTVVFLLSQQ
jgi:hypothetical protein